MGKVNRILSIFLLALSFSVCCSCATTSGKSNKSHRSSSKSHAKKSAKNKKAPKNYGIYRARELDRRLLNRGQKAMHGSALDPY
jgi:hypothetical protein